VRAGLARATCGPSRTKQNAAPTTLEQLLAPSRRAALTSVVNTWNAKQPYELETVRI
jgi:hypothetical protein